MIVRELLWRAACLCVLCLPALAGAQTPASQPAPRVQQVEFQDLPLGEAVRMLGRQTGLNLVASQEAGKLKVTLFLQDVTPQAVIEELCRANNLWFRQDDSSGIVRIMTLAEFQRDLTSFREERTQVFAVLYPNAVSTATAIADLYGDRVQLSLGDAEAAEESRELTDRFGRFDIIDQRSQGTGTYSASGASIVGNTGSSVSSSSGGSHTTRRGGSAGMADTGSDLGPLTPQQAQSLAKALKDQQTTPEGLAVMDSLRRSPANIYVRVIRRNNLIVVRSSDQSAIEEIGKLVQRLDVPTPTVLLEVKVLSIALGDDFTSVFDYQFSDGSTLGGTFSGGEIQPSASDRLSGDARKFAAMTPGGTGLQSKDLVFQFVSNSFRLRMQLLEGKNRVTELATPLLLTANNEVSRLFVGEERPIVRNISSQLVVNNNNTTVSPNTSIEFRPVGTTLLITPNINADRTVTFRILQENSRIVANGAKIPVVTSNGGIVSQPVDVVATRTLSGTIVAKDGLMLAVGGLIEENLNDARDEVPILGSIPGLGFFFRRQATGRSRNEMIIMIRPHVLNTPAESEAISRDLVRSLSLHPAANQPTGTLKTFKPDEVLRPNLPKSKGESIFRFHNVKPADY